MWRVYLGAVGIIAGIAGVERGEPTRTSLRRLTPGMSLAYLYTGHGLPIWGTAIAVVGIGVRLYLWRRKSK